MLQCQRFTCFTQYMKGCANFWLFLGRDFVMPDCSRLPEVTSPEGRRCMRIGLISGPPDVGGNENVNNQDGSLQNVNYDDDTVNKNSQLEGKKLCLFIKDQNCITYSLT